ncbi:MAG: beta family protein, partial [Gammaproteobacteria bacterium]
MVGRGPRYVPILRTKPAEWDALCALTPDVREVVTPCLQVLPRELHLDDPMGSTGLRRAFQRLAMKIGRTWG